MIKMRSGGLVLAVVWSLAAGAAAARNEPNPPPSGIVVHLFGPGSLTSGMMPGQPSGPVVTHVPVPPANKPLGGAANEQPAPPSAGSIPPMTAASTATATGTAGGDAGPGLGPILHQMFVTGDPDAKPGSGLATGRANERAP